MKNILTRCKRKLRSSFFSPYTIQTNFLNEHFSFYVGTFEGSLWYGKDKDKSIDDITPELEWTKSHLLPGEVMADVGAHHGYFALLYSRWVGDEGTIYSFECNPTNCSIIEENLKINNIKNIRNQSVAVGNEAGEVLISNDSSGLLLGDKKDKKIKIPMVSLDEVFFAKEKVTPTIIKIDVEGYEYEVLEGSRRLLDTKPKVILEIHNFAHEQPKKRLEKIFDFFAGYTKTYWQSHPGYKICPFPLTKENLDVACQQPNPHLYLVP